MKGLYIVPRHAKLIHSGRKKLIVKKRHFRAIVRLDMGLITKVQGKGQLLGYIRLKSPFSTDSKGLKRLRGRHLITDKEKIDWWPNTKKFYVYEIEKYYPLRKPKSITVKKGVQTIQSDFSGITASLKDCIKDISTYDPTKIPKRVLGDDWRIVIAWYSSLLKGRGPEGLTKQKLIILARGIYQQMLRLGFKFHPEKMKPNALKLYKLVSKKDFYLQINQGSISKKFSEVIQLNDFLKKWDSFKIFKDGIFVCGSLVNKGETNGDIDIVVKADYDSDMFNLIKWRVERAYPEWQDRIHVSSYGKWKGPFTNHVNLADIVAVNNQNLRVHNMKSNSVRLKFDGNFMPVLDKINQMWG